jgi:hypothetical protein
MKQSLLKSLRSYDLWNVRKYLSVAVAVSKATKMCPLWTLTIFQTDERRFLVISFKLQYISMNILYHK